MIREYRGGGDFARIKCVHNAGGPSKPIGHLICVYVRVDLSPLVGSQELG